MSATCIEWVKIALIFCALTALEAQQVSDVEYVGSFVVVKITPEVSYEIDRQTWETHCT